MARALPIVALWVASCGGGPTVVPPSTREALVARIALDARTDASTKAHLRQVVFSPTGTRAAYTVTITVPATEGTPEGMVGSYVVVDGKPGPLLRSVSPPVFSPDGKHVAYSGSRGQEDVLYVDGDIVRGHKVIYPPFFGRGGRWAYVEESDSGGKMSMVVDGEPGPRFDYVWPQGFAPDGERVVYTARLRGKVFAVVGGERSRLLDSIGAIAFNRTGSKLAYSGCQTKRCSVFVRGDSPKPLPPGAEHITFGPDLQRFAYQQVDGSQRFWVVDRKPQPPFDDVSAVQLSPDGHSFAYAARMSGRRWLIRDGARVASYDDIGDVQFSPDGQRLAFAARSHQLWQVVVDGSVGRTFDRVAGPVFSPDGRTVAYVAYYNNTANVVVGSEIYGPFDAVDSPISFDAGGQRVMFGARLGRELWWKVVSVSSRMDQTR